MALVTFRGFNEGVTGADPASKMIVDGGSEGTWRGGTYDSRGRSGPGSLRINSSAHMEYLPPSPLSTITFGFAYNFAESDSGGQFCGMMLNTTANARAAGDTGPYLDATSTGLHLYAGDGTLLDSAPDGVIAMATWHYYEFQVVMDGTSGTGAVKVRVDGIERMSVPSGTTITGDPSKNDIQRIHFKANSYSSYGQYKDELLDDVYVRDDAVFMGAVKIPMLRPTGNGTYTDGRSHDYDQATPTTEYDAVNDTPMNDSATFMEVTSGGQKHSFQLDDLDPAATSVLGVRHMGWLGAPSGQSGSVKNFFRTNGSDYDDTTHAVSATYGGRPGAILETNPDTGAAWTPAEINALELGYELPA